MQALDFDKKTWRCSIFGYLLYACLKKNNCIDKNIQHVFSKKISLAKQKKFCIAYLSHLMVIFKELLLMMILKERFFKNKDITIQGVEHISQAIETGKGVIILSGHFHNWEWLSFIIQSLYCQQKLKAADLKFYCIRKRLRYSFLTKLFFGQFEKVGITVIERQYAIRKVFYALKNKGIVVFPFDLKPPQNEKYAVEGFFLGQPTTSYSTLAYLVKKTGAVVIPMGYYQKNRKTLGVDFYQSIPWEEYSTTEESFIINTQKYNQALEKIIFKQPAQWNWAYKRW